MLACMREHIAEKYAFSGMQERVRSQNFFQRRQRAARSLKDAAAVHRVSFFLEVFDEDAQTLPRYLFCFFNTLRDELFGLLQFQFGGSVVGLFSMWVSWINKLDTRALNHSRRTYPAGKRNHGRPSRVRAKAQSCAGQHPRNSTARTLEKLPLY